VLLNKQRRRPQDGHAISKSNAVLAEQRKKKDRKKEKKKGLDQRRSTVLFNKKNHSLRRVHRGFVLFF